MNGPQDLGGMMTLGAINPEPETEEPLFREDWERTAFALTLAAGGLGLWSIDRARYARERQHPVDYLRNSYYENWMAGLERLLLEEGIVTAEELKSGKVESQVPDTLQSRKVPPENVATIMAKGSSAEMAAGPEARFKPGDRVKVTLLNTKAHIRAPRYVRGQVGVIQEHYGTHIFPDRSAIGEKTGEPLYNVRFEGVDLWGPGAENQSVHIDLWDSYLTPA